jgi:biopolymer transport protein ExbD
MKKLKLKIRPRADINITPFIDILLVFNDVAQLVDASKIAGVERIGLMTEQVREQ